MRRKWQPLAAASSCSPARAGEAAACTQRVALPPPETGQQVLLHIESNGGELRVNGTLLALPASTRGAGADITNALRPGKEQQISLRAPNAARALAAAWCEVVPAHRITRLLADTVPTAEALNVTVTANSPGEVEVELRDGAQVVAAVKGAAGEKLWLKPARPRLWSPSDPFLYQLTVRLATGDSVTSYAALRTVTVAKDARGVMRTHLNGQPVFFHGIEFPAIETAPPPDPAAILRLGFNTVRLRTLAPPAWYSACDRAGLLVWQDLPVPVSRASALAAVESLRVYPSIALWTLFDEATGQEALGLDAARSLAGEIARLDPARLVNGASGWFDTGNGHVRAMHFSPGPAMFDPGPRRASLLARYGQLPAAT
ncbi:MAG: hypothetical protein J0L64_22720, partial [Acidobacteria bacterium]|nr:hypothetical protein [Acidobacteriota bacterium]